MSPAESELRREARELLDAGIRAVAPAGLVRAELGRRIESLRLHPRVAMAAFGKAAAGMARGAVQVLGERIERGVVVVPVGGETDGLDRFRRVAAGHPLPDAGSLEAGETVWELAVDCGPDDLLLCLISGGGSSLVALPAAGVSFTGLREATARLIASGAEIEEINRARSGLDRIKAGGLARAARAGKVLGLLLSDVVGDRARDIASGPLTPTPVGRDGIETVIVGSGRSAVEAVGVAAVERGYRAEVLSTGLTGEARDVGARLASIAREARAAGERVCVVAAGETTVTLRGNGRGGRNQELVLGAVAGLDGVSDVLVASIGTDGIDGPTEAAGAMASGSTRQRGIALGLDDARSLANNDAHEYFAALDDLIVTGPTGTNVADLQIVLVP